MLYLCLQGTLLLLIFSLSRLHAQMFLCVFPCVAATVVLFPPVAAAIGVAALPMR